MQVPLSGRKDTPEAVSRRSTATVGMEKVLIDIPVYRLSKSDYDQQQTEWIEKEVERNCGPLAAEFFHLHPEELQRAKGYLWDRYGGGWLYNEIIGFIRLFFFFSQIRGEYWRLSTKRIVRTRHKKFSPLGWEITYPEEIPIGMSSREIFGLILRFLERAQNEKELRRRFIDTSVLENMGAHVDWKALLEEQFTRQPVSDLRL